MQVFRCRFRSAGVQVLVYRCRLRIAGAGVQVQRVVIIWHHLGQRFGDFAHSYARMKRLESAKSPNLGPVRCLLIPTLPVKWQVNVPT